MEKSKEGVMMIFFKNGRLLVERRGQKSSISGKVVFPGGAVEESEKNHAENYLHVTLKREAFEELGVTGLKFDFIRTLEVERSERYKLPDLIFHYFLVTAWEGRIPDDGEDGEKLFWIDSESISELSFEEDRKLAASILNQPNMLRYSLL